MRMEAAMDWLLQLHSDDSSDEDVCAWLAWYESDPRNRETFDAMRDFWLQSGRLTELGAGMRERLPELGAGNLAERESRPSRRFRSFNLRSRTLQSPLRTVGIAAAALLVLWFGARSLDLSTRPLGAGATKQHVPLVRHAQLPDGSAVDLAPDSVMAIQFTPAERTIALERGEAFFSVAPNRARPFIVKTAGVRVRAVGTEFNVRQALGRVTVTVTEGTVDISADRTQARSDPSGALRLGAGNELVWDESIGQHTVRATQSDRALAWRSGRLEYIDEPLDAVITDVNRYSSRRIVIQDRQIGRLTYTGTVFTWMVDEWIQALPSAFPVRLVSHGDSLMITSLPESMQAANAAPAR
jgi:transmembrane sensor